MHVAPDSAAAGSEMRSPEDLLAPIMYANLALSAAVVSNVRIVGEGFAGFSTHDMIVRIADHSAAHWGVPLTGLALRAEWVMQ
jgi:hypothetical protein